MAQRTFWSIIALLIAAFAHAQAQLNGIVRDPAGQPLPFASLSMGETTFGAQSDAEGRFVLKGLHAGALRAEVVLVGYATLDTLLMLSDGPNEVQFTMLPQETMLRDVEVTALRAGDRSPFAHSTVTRDDLQKTNTGVDMPLLLDQLPSVVTTTDAGTGFGYSGLRIRGSDATRINVTINGVPLNDAESQAVYWVDLPDLATSTEDIEVQRGIGSSTNGPGAFGASVNVRTTAINKEANASISAFAGSYGTQRYSASLGTGLIKDHFSFDGRISSITSDGYIDRATADLKSYFLQGAWIGRKSSLRFITFSGHEVTYQAWNGVPKEIMDTDRTWNEFTYDHQVDDYTQTHYQLLLDRKLSDNADLNVTLFRVNGAGFYEEKKDDAALIEHGIAPVVLGEDTIRTSDLIRRKWLDNALTGVNLDLNIRHARHRIIMGGSYSDYSGEHYGEVIWARFAGASDIRHRFYDNTAKKTDANAFAKLTCALTNKLDLFGDAQLRFVEHRFLGFDAALINTDQTVRYTFFNPKAGLQWRFRTNMRAYASAAVGNREPNRDDLDQTTPTSRPTSEHMVDYEIGYAFGLSRFTAQANAYHMDYRDQLVLTGKLNDVGAALRTNVPSSYRQGIELQAGVRPIEGLSIGANASFSRNRIRDFTDHADDYDNGGQRATTFHETDIAFSPDVVAGGNVSYRIWNSEPHGSAEITWITKYVSRQFLDNTASIERSLDPYIVHDLRANVTFLGIKGVKRMDINLTVRNLFSELYESNGWSYSYWESGQRISGVGYYPQAPLNVLGGLTVRF